MTYQVISLREEPQHLPVIAEWIHQQWWSETDTPIEAIKRWLGTHLGEKGFPATFVVISEGELVGSVSLHETEADDRPAYTPYLGALFVKPSSRGRGFGTALVRSVEAQASRLGCPTLYLNTADALTGFYEALGWRIVERAYGRKRLNIMTQLLQPGRISGSGMVK
jgi:GNAT superfamily N-acetyltransferase